MKALEYANTKWVEAVYIVTRESSIRAGDFAKMRVGKCCGQLQSVDSGFTKSSIPSGSFHCGSNPRRSRALVMSYTNI